ncbi:exosortase family protein XrtF [Salinibacter ruber]|uniref:exosortase X n=1 Tax=Salinibacter ruber TaxID=146919 RepID=UPI002168BCEA|nr:exosortase/archaeosortase family protein [Salinibacter ruber]MCS4177375.1 exosortase family protein XrtF [Salinibacter ruber]
MTADPNSNFRWSRYGPVLQFLAKAVAIYGAWYVLYDLWLLPDGRLDAWVSQTVVHAGRVVLSGVGIEAVVNGRSIELARASGIRIVDGCNGLATIGLFAGFVLAFPGSTRRRLLFIPFGIGVIYLANVARVSLLAGLQVYWPPAFEFVHDLGATAFFHLIVFGLWVLWANYGSPSEGPASDSGPDVSIERSPAVTDV